MRSVHRIVAGEDYPHTLLQRTTEDGGLIKIRLGNQWTVVRRLLIDYRPYLFNYQLINPSGVHLAVHP